MNPAPHRFTIDGSDQLECRLQAVCRQILARLKALVPASKLEAVVLAGGYGRGQGGVLKSPKGDQPYNDLEFYVFLYGPVWFNARRYGHALRALGEQLSPETDVHVEFKIDSLAALRRRPVSMFSYDLVSRHLRLWGAEDLFRGCAAHLEASRLPPVEATRLLLNRCSGLLLAKSRLSQDEPLTQEQSDFIVRNLAKLRLAMGDAVLTALGQYHWSCLERRTRLLGISSTHAPPDLAQIKRAHAEGIAFKLHPWRADPSKEAFGRQLEELSRLAFKLWIWLESLRLGVAFASARDYALSPLEKCGRTSPWRNYLLNLRSFGPKALLSAACRRYPRERLFNTLPLLLWCEPSATEPDVRLRMQEQLMTTTRDWSGWLAAYEQLWPNYG